MTLRWAWSEEKNWTNKNKHGISFETAKLVFDDPFHLSRPDPHPDGDRWRTVGRIAAVTVLVVHTWPEPAEQKGEEKGRIISARKATARERRAYEEGGF